MDISLYIKDTLADVGDKTAFARNFKQTKQFSDIENPLNITTDFSYSISLPGTDNNRRIFGWIESGTNTDIFNPNSAVPYHLNINGYLVSEGNVQLTEVKVTNGAIEFSCSFYSKVHQIMMDLSNKLMKDLNILKDEDYYKHYLNIDLMDRVWAGYHDLCEIIRYVPCRAGMYPNFQSSKVFSPSGSGYDAFDLGTDCDEYAMREYRIQYQRPALSVGKLMTGIRNDFDITMDSSITYSPYIAGSWLMCPQMSQEDKSEECTGTTSTTNGLTISVTPTSTPGYVNSSMNMSNMTQTSTLSTGETIFSGSSITPEENCFNVNVEFCVRIDCSANVDSSHGNFNPGNNPNTIYLAAWDANMNMVPRVNLTLVDASNSSHTIISQESDTTPQWAQGNLVLGTKDPYHIYYRRTDNNVYSTANYRMECNSWSISGWGNSQNKNDLFPVHFTFPLDRFAPNFTWKSHFFITALQKVLWQSCNEPPEGTTYDRYRVSNYRIQLVPMESLTTEQLTVLQDAGFIGKTFSYSSKSLGRSPMYVDINKIFGSEEFTCKDFLTDITKMLGCVWEFDSSGNINITTRNNYFKDYSVLNWTNKLDRSSISYKPLSFNKRTYTMSYADGKSMLEENYTAEIGKDYGKQYIDTGYPFNDETESLIETKFLNTVQSKGDRKCVWRSGNEFTVHSQTPYEIPMIEKKDHGAPEEKFRLLFNNGVTMLENNEKVFLTQDSSIMYSDDIGGKCWMDLTYANDDTKPEIYDNTREMDRIPLFSTRYNYASWDFAKSQISYSGENDTTYDPNSCLYPRFWNKYIRALYNAKTRVMTAKFHLDAEDLLSFSFKNFVIIDNHLWHPNKLIDYNMSGEDLTQVELIEVTDVDSWVNGQNWNFKNAPQGSTFRNENFAEPDVERYEAEDAENDERENNG